jgi:hypothetical protein
MAHNPGAQTPLRSRDLNVIRFASRFARNEIELLGVLPRAGVGDLSGPLSSVRVYADLNTFRIALVPQSE